MELNDRHVVVTGGSRGVGAAIGAAFAAAGARVTLVARNETQLAKAASACGGGYLAADLLDLDALPALVSRMTAVAPIDILVNNAGLGLPSAVEDLSSEQLRALFTLNALVPAELTRLVLPALRHRAIARLVFVSSLSAQVSLPGLTAYSATKAAVSQFAEGLRRDLSNSAIGVTTAELGPIHTEMYGEIEGYQPCADAFNRMLRLGTLRMLEPEEVATAIVMACRRDKSRVVLPRRGRSQVVASHLPQWAANRML
ncbi:MAG TPA: SDR family oxidoreductase [Mycobacteriales bacterium]|nr:SDR family oxidoreductase [Mycobacteriales bacterium]